MPPVARLPGTLSAGELAPKGDDSWFRQVVHGFIGAASVLQGFREGFAEALAVSPNQYLVLIAAAYLEGEERPTIADLAKYLGIAQPHVTTDAGRLVRAGLLRKEPHPSDRRSILIRVSPQGRSALEGVASLVRTVNDVLFADITMNEMAVLDTVTTRLVRNAIRARAELALALPRA